MNPEAKKLWVDALRSGKYKQGRDFLLMNGRHCCLGVLCEVAEQAGVPIHRTQLSGKEFEFNGNASELPLSVMKWAELTEADPIIDGKPAAERNDKLCNTFPQIADLIEKHL